MKIIDEALLARLRRGGGCEWCRIWSPFRHPHHLWGRGMGGATRLDVRINLVSLCPECHHRTHRGHIQRCDLLARVAARERRLQGDIEDEIRRLRRVRR